MALSLSRGWATGCVRPARPPCPHRGGHPAEPPTVSAGSRAARITSCCCQAGCRREKTDCSPDSPGRCRPGPACTAPRRWWVSHCQPSANSCPSWDRPCSRLHSSDQGTPGRVEQLAMVRRRITQRRRHSAELWTLSARGSSRCIFRRWQLNWTEPTPAWLPRMDSNHQPCD